MAGHLAKGPEGYRRAPLGQHQEQTRPHAHSGDDDIAVFERSSLGSEDWRKSPHAATCTPRGSTPCSLRRPAPPMRFMATATPALHQLVAVRWAAAWWCITTLPFRGGADGVQQSAGMAELVAELHGAKPQVKLFMDNTAAIGLCRDAAGSWKTRHLRVRAHHLREAVKAGELVVKHIPGLQQLADLGTKAFDGPRLLELLKL